MTNLFIAYTYTTKNLPLIIYNIYTITHTFELLSHIHTKKSLYFTVKTGPSYRVVYPLFDFWTDCCEYGGMSASAAVFMVAQDTLEFPGVGTV